MVLLYTAYHYLIDHDLLFLIDIKWLSLLILIMYP